ncbi:MAG TPA: hypothetical protein VGU71_03250 [Candidatus Dormibacteraeota bacterium]|nr:hypothetical protein [Candidatus Dormibacteraeota bacterium]
MNSRTVTLTLLLGSVLVACGTTPASTTSQSSPATATASPAPASPATKLYVLAPEAGSSVGGTIQMDVGAGGVTLTATLTGLNPGGSYIVDADPLPCLLFVGGPSQSFAKPVTVDSSGHAKVVWTVPSGMNGNASVQGLTNQGTFAVLACADLTQ